MLSAYEHDGDLPLPALVVFGPFMLPEQQAVFAARAARLPNVHAITFDARLEALMARAAGVVAMGGYNTFCEILSFDKPALIMPRTAPRLEQYIRAERAAELGLVAMLSERAGSRPAGHGRGAAAIDQPAAALERGDSRSARRDAERQPAGEEMARPGPGRACRGAGAPRGLIVPPPSAPSGGRVAFVLKGYPRLSETFIAQEILALERRGLGILIVSLRHPTDRAIHPVHQPIRRTGSTSRNICTRSRCGSGAAGGSPAAYPAIAARDAAGLPICARDPTPNRIRRFGQALVLAAELPADVRHLHAHFLHTPASVARYAALIAGLDWTVSAHAKDIWTIPDWESAGKARRSPLGGDLHGRRTRAFGGSGAAA